MEFAEPSAAGTQERGGNQLKRKYIASSDGNLAKGPGYSGSRIEQGPTGSTRTPQSSAPTSTLTLTEQGQPYAEPTIMIYLGAEKQQIPQSKFLSHIWEHGLDSPCMVCGQDFKHDEPPIRTVAFETSQDLLPTSLDIMQTLITPHPIRIFNRHFTCIKAEKIDYIPVSHAWHQAVATAQKFHAQNIETARLVYQVSVKSLLALFKKNVTTEIWHDYLSVPQWQHKIQQQLLLAIPTIYSYPSRMVIHLDDVKMIHLDAIHQNANYQTFLEGISRLTRSRWFDRMWVTLEYIQGREVSILTEEFDIFSTSAGDLSLLVEKSIEKYVKQFGHDKFTESTLAAGYRWSKRVSWTDMETWKNRDPKHRTLGGAIYIIGQKECREYHDYFFALRGLLGLGQNRVQVTSILDGDTFQSCLSISWQSLEKGDYSPLLFTPLKGEQRDQRAPWLHGHSKISEDLWDLGMCHQKARSQTIIRAGLIQPELESVGIIEEFEYCNFSGNPKSVFRFVASNILRSSGVSAKAFCGAIDRVFPRSGRKALHTHWEKSSDLISPEETDTTYNFDLLGNLLLQYSTLTYQDQTSHHALLDISQKIMDITGLAKREKETSVSRIKTANGEAEWYGERMEGLARIRCKFCAGRSLFRLTVWEAPKPETAQVYRIPGLLYDETIPEGVGLVMCKKRIVGKMAYGTPACGCHRVELVEVGS